MRSILAGLLFAVVVPSLVRGATADVKESGRERILIDAGWKFHLGDEPVSSGGVPVTKWRWRTDDRGEPISEEMAAPDLSSDGADWKDATTGDDVFQGRKAFAWFRTALPAAPGAHHSLHFESVDDDATVYLNGRKLLYHEGWNEPFDVPLDAAWRECGPNVLAVLVGNSGAGPGGIIGSVLLQADDGKIAEGPPNPSFNDRDWRRVDLPHDYVVEGSFDPKGDRSHGYLPKGVGWYRKEIHLPASDKGKRLWLEFDGIYRNSTVWLNGRVLGRHISGYTSFYFDISDFARYGGKNVLAVRVDANSNEGWWYEGGGIYRHTWLTKLSPVHVAHWGTFVTSVVQDGDKGASDAADLTLKTSIANEGKADAACQLVSKILDAEGKEIGVVKSDETIAAGGCPEVTQELRLLKPKLWSIEAPNLYKLQTTILQDRRAVDATESVFGIRTIRFDPDKGFFLNGQPVKIKGTCNHQDFAGVGIALPDRIHVYRIEKLKEMGSNAFRCSHNPPASELLDACDRLGMVVMDENRHLGSSPETLSQVESMVLRDRNHPSIIMWSMCNEEGLQGTEKGASMFSAMKEVVRRYDATRPVTCAMNGGWGQGITLVEDLQGCNYNPGGYDGFHKAFPNQPIYASETASHVSTRGIYTTDKEKGYVDHHSGNPEWSWKPIAERPFMAGSFVWTGFDYRGEPSPYDWPCISSHFGIMDTCGFPKDSYWYYKAWWGTEPVVHVFPHWNWPGKEGQETEVWCYGNCEKVELLVNGQSAGAKDMPRYGHVDWKVKYAPGSLQARGLNGDKVVATDRVETTGAPSAIRLTPDRTEILADNEDVCIIPAAILDEAGRVVPTADNEVVFSVKGEGKIIGVGNGDPSCHEADKASKRHAFNGYCLVIVQSTAKAGEIRLGAESQGLKPTSVVIRSRTRRK